MPSAPLAIAGTRLLDGLLYGVRPADWRAFLLVASDLVAVGSIAALVPSLRAGRTDPAAVLRSS